MLHNTLPDLYAMKVFGCLCYVSTLKHNRKKLDPRARRCIYLGVKSGVKGYLVYDLKTREIFLSRDVNFYKRFFPYKDKNLLPSPNLDLILPHYPSQTLYQTYPCDIQENPPAEPPDNSPTHTATHTAEPLDNSPINTDPAPSPRPSRNR